MLKDVKVIQCVGSCCRLTQQRQGLEQAADLLAGPQAGAASVGEAAEAVHPAQEPAVLSLGLTVQLLQQLGGHREAALERRGYQRIPSQMYR